jgi:hypothetical protein
MLSAIAPAFITTPHAVKGSFQDQARPLSLRPGDESVIDGFLEANPIAVAIIEAWRPKLPIRDVSPEEFVELSAACAGAVFCA